MNRINLFSKEWCELVFAEKNKTYGAYRIRMESTRRHVKAMVIVFLTVGLLILVNVFITKGADQDATLVAVIDNAHVFQNFNNDEDLPDPIVIEIPPVPIVETIKFLEMIVVDDALVKEEDMVLTQEALSEGKAKIAGFTHEGNTEGPGFFFEDVDVIAPVAPVENNQIVDYVEQMPIYPGGEKEMMDFLYKNLNYPVVDLELGTEGTVRVRFVVEKDGSIGNVEIIRPLSVNCDREAIRVIKKMPTWIPGKQNGVAVRVYYNLPVRFKLQK